MTRQQMFNTAYHGLAAQGFLASSREMMGGRIACAYRGNGGARCAIGYLISDETAADWEGVGLLGIDNDAFVAAGFNNEDRLFLSALQSVHDESVSPEDMLRRIRRFAKIYGLTVPTLPISAEAPAKEIEHAESEWRDFAPAE
jgi:hypothetical protein